MVDSRELKWRSALLEGFAVMVGILLAFSIDAWWDLRTQREEAHAYLEAVRTELLENREILNEDLEMLRKWVSESEGFLNRVVAPNASPSYDEVREMVWQIGPDQTIPLLRVAVDDLISSGGVKGIDSAKLRRALAGYVRALDHDASEQDGVRQVFDRFVLPYHLDNGSFTEFEWEGYAEVDQSPVTFQLDPDAFVANRRYANLLISRMLGYSNLRDSHRDVVEEIDGTLALIDELL